MPCQKADFELRPHPRRIGRPIQLALIFASTLLAASAWSRARADEAPRRPPNIVLILADDLGQECLGCYGGTSYKTPNLDALAKSGARFPYCYCTPLCSPSRVELMTGRYGFRTGWTQLIAQKAEKDQFLDPKEKTFGHVLKNAGYVTAIAGKWQLAQLDKHPTHLKDCGFDHSCCWTWMWKGGKTSRYWEPTIYQDGKLRDDVKNKFGEDVYCDYLIDFIKSNKDRPFFAYYPMALVHEPFVPTPDDKEKEKGAQSDKKEKKDTHRFPGMVAYMDKTVGRVTAVLDDLKLRDNTIILFTGDNGTDRAITSQCNGVAIPGGKGTMTDRGTHVPLIVNWQGTSPAGSVCEDLVDFSDFLPTLAELTGAKLPGGVTLDGQSFAPQLQGKPGKPRSWVFCQLGKARYLRDSRWELHHDNRLFDLKNDPFEKKNIPAGADQEADAARKRLQPVLDRLK